MLSAFHHPSLSQCPAQAARIAALYAAVQASRFHQAAETLLEARTMEAAGDDECASAQRPTFEALLATALRRNEWVA